MCLTRIVPPMSAASREDSRGVGGGGEVAGGFGQEHSHDEGFDVLAGDVAGGENAVAAGVHLFQGEAAVLLVDGLGLDVG